MAEGMGSQSRWKRCRLAVVVVVLAVVVVDVVVIVVAAVVVAVALAVAAVVVVVALVVALAPPVHVVVLWCQVQRAFTSSLPILASDARSAVLSSGAEFHEAVLRLVRAHPSLSLPRPRRRPLTLTLTLPLTLPLTAAGSSGARM